ncbi:hypothetical protein [Sorangium sp. So ce131]|uniref:hypothetical protein n=1 Tax=Sorangium sp. So ce131 TaxID=3133282 RepID=UPI003F637A73
MDDLESYLGLVVAALWLIVQIAKAMGWNGGALVRAWSERAAAHERASPDEIAPPREAPPREVPFGAPRAIEAERRQAALFRLDALERGALSLGEAVRHERANRRFVDVLTGYVPQEIARARAAVAAGLPAGEAEDAADTLELVLGEIAVLVRQRRDPALLAQLGDADALADACYAPVIAFARAEGLPLRSGAPATQLTDFDLALWTGFLPTSIAPIFLPPDFFSTPAYWPAIAHEIGHDFLASVEGLEPALRRELGLPGGARPARLRALDGDDIAAPELTAALGAWFEEIFCDVFGTSMLGPAYVLTMSSLFAREDAPYEVIAVHTDAAGARYDPHPPPHLRVLIGCMALERGGFPAQARAISEGWARRHAGAPLDALLFPARRGWRPVPLSPFVEASASIVERLHAGPLVSLSGFGLRDVRGVDYGPHMHMEALRARDVLRAGRVPSARDARAIVAGAVLAAQDYPGQAIAILANARAAIPAVGTSERRADAFAPDAAAPGAALTRRDVTEALILREALLPPRALRGRRRARL